MGADAHLDWRHAAASALAWWDAAGVDTLIEEAPRDWLKPIARAAESAADHAAAPGSPPGTVVDFLAWRRGADSLEADWPGEWVPASGPADAPLMVLVDCPDRDDRAALLGGAAGRLFDHMLAAIGLDRNEVHLAALCAKRPAAGRVPAEHSERLAALALHHVTLVAPRILLVLGNAASRAVLATDVAPARGRLHALNHDSEMTVIASFHPRFLLEKSAAKAGAWADLLMVKRGLNR